MNTHLIIPILVPLFTAMVLTFFSRQPVLQRAMSLASALGVLGYVLWLLFYVDQHGIQTMAVGGWEAPWGIVFVADRLAAIMLCLTMGVGTVAMIYTFWTVTRVQQQYFFYPLMHVLMGGVNWSFLTGDLFNLFVSYEVMLISSYAMMMAGASRQQLRQTFKYIVINAIGSSLFVAAIGLIYATVGTLNMADIAVQTTQLTGQRAAMVTAASIMLLVVFSIKSGAFPLFFWLPDSYPIVPSGVIGFFAGMLTKVGVYSLLRVFITVFQQEGGELIVQILLVLSGFTMLLGVLGAMCQWDIRRILSWHIISQVGYMLMGIGFTGHVDPLIVNMAIAGTIFYVAHNIIVKSCLFLVGGIAERITGTQELKKMGGLLNVAPGVAGLFLVAGLSIAGIPPFTGFAGKFTLIGVGFSGGYFLVVAVAIITSFFTLYSMMKIWTYVFWGKAHESQWQPLSYRGMMAPTAVLVLATTAFGVFAQPFIDLASKAATDVRDPNNYVTAVLGQGAWPVVAEAKSDEADAVAADDVEQSPDAERRAVAVVANLTREAH